METANALSTDLGERAQQFADKELAGPVTTLIDALTRLGQQTGHSETLDGASAQVLEDLAMFPQAVGMSAYHTEEVDDVVPRFMVQNLAGIQNLMQMYQTRTGDWTDVSPEAQRTAKIVSDAVNHLQQRLHPQLVDEEVVMPSVQRFAP